MAAFSINTNVGAQIALHSLGAIETNLGKAQTEVSTGQKVAGARDQTAVFAVAQGVRANLAQYAAIGTALNDGQTLIGVALTGATAISNLISGITQTLGSLADGSISVSQRVVYTGNLKSQIDEVQTFINAATYNGVDLLAANGGTTTNAVSNGGFTAFTSAHNVSILSGLDGAALTVHAQNLTGGTAGTDGFLGLARLVYFVGQSAGADLGAFPLYDLQSTNNVNVDGYGSGLVSRPVVSQQEAIAALAPLSARSNAYLVGTQTQSGETVYLAQFSFSEAYYGSVTVTSAIGTASVFNSAVAAFSSQVNAALGSLAADNANIQAQITFAQSLSDTTTGALGNLVDADLSRVSAQLTSLQTQRQLAMQALSIASANPSNLLGLFKAA